MFGQGLDHQQRRAVADFETRFLGPPCFRIISSDQPKKNGFSDEEREQAWVQPVPPE